MSDITLLKNKIQELEDRIKILEGDKLWNDAILDKKSYSSIINEPPVWLTSSAPKV